MSDFVRLTQTPAGVRLCATTAIPNPGARSFVLEIGHGRFHGFVVRRGDAFRGYLDRCPHMALPLARRLDAYLTPDGDLIACGWHGALFRIHDGKAVAGPCRGEALTPWPVRVDDGNLETA